MSPRSTWRNGTPEFTLAYVVRAVTPGEFKYPALVVEDMYEPETTGRTAIGKLTCSRDRAPRLEAREPPPQPSPAAGEGGRPAAARSEATALRRKRGRVGMGAGSGWCCCVQPSSPP